MPCDCWGSAHQGFRASHSSCASIGRNGILGTLGSPGSRLACVAEQASGGLVATPTGLARIMIAFQNALAGKPSPIDAEVAEAMMQREPGTPGRGLPPGHRPGPAGMSLIPGHRIRRQPRCHVHPPARRRTGRWAVRLLRIQLRRPRIPRRMQGGRCRMHPLWSAPHPRTWPPQSSPSSASCTRSCAASPPTKAGIGGLPGVGRHARAAWRAFLTATGFADSAQRADDLAPSRTQALSGRRADQDLHEANPLPIQSPRRPAPIPRRGPSR